MAQLLRLFALLFTAILLASCADHLVRESTRVDYGYVESLQVYRAADNKPIDVGTVLGGIAGGIIGHQIGSGSGQTAATIAGAIGGAILGHHVERNVSGSRYRITVRLDSGSTLVVDDTRDVDLRVGDRVRIENDRVRRNMTAASLRVAKRARWRLCSCGSWRCSPRPHTRPNNVCGSARWTRSSGLPTTARQHPGPSSCSHMASTCAETISVPHRGARCGRVSRDCAESHRLVLPSVRRRRIQYVPLAVEAGSDVDRRRLP